MPAKPKIKALSFEAEGYAFDDIRRLVGVTLQAGISVLLRGHPGVGKSSLAAELADAMNLEMVDIRLAQRDPAELAGVYFPDRENGELALFPPAWVRQACAEPTFVFLDEVNAAVSAVAAVPEVRHLLVTLQRGLLQHGDLIMEGRDIGSVVFPDTPYKIYIEASEEVRRERRAAEGQTDSVGDRDRKDSARKTSPLVVPEGAEVIDSSRMIIEEVVEAAVRALRARGWFDRKSETHTP